MDRRKGTSLHAQQLAPPIEIPNDSPYNPARACPSNQSLNDRSAAL